MQSVANVYVPEQGNLLGLQDTYIALTGKLQVFYLRFTETDPSNRSGFIYSSMFNFLGLTQMCSGIFPEISAAFLKQGNL